MAARPREISVLPPEVLSEVVSKTTRLSEVENLLTASPLLRELAFRSISKISFDAPNKIDAEESVSTVFILQFVRLETVEPWVSIQTSEHLEQLGELPHLRSANFFLDLGAGEGLSAIYRFIHRCNDLTGPFLFRLHRENYLWINDGRIYIPYLGYRDSIVIYKRILARMAQTTGVREILMTVEPSQFERYSDDRTLIELGVDPNSVILTIVAGWASRYATPEELSDTGDHNLYHLADFTDLSCHLGLTKISFTDTTGPDIFVQSQNEISSYLDSYNVAIEIALDEGQTLEEIIQGAQLRELVVPLKLNYALDIIPLFPNLERIGILLRDPLLTHILYLIYDTMRHHPNIHFVFFHTQELDPEAFPRAFRDQITLVHLQQYHYPFPFDPKAALVMKLTRD